MFSCFLVFLIFCFMAFLYWSIEPVATDAAPVSSTKVLSRDGGLLYEVARPIEGLRTAVTLSHMPASLKDALIATEDKRFYSHSGLDRLAILRVGFEFATTGRMSSGGSTLEMQLMKNLFFAGEPRSVLEKAREITAAEFWALTHSKDETLEKYLNTIPLGNGTSGVQAASQRYFRKDVSDLTVGESTLLVGMMNAPSRYDPYKHQSVALTRRRTVLSRLVEAGKISSVDAEDAAATPPVIWAPKHPITAPHFVERVLSELETTIPDIRDGGYVIQTTLDTDLQTQVENIIERRLTPLSNRNVNDAAAIVLDPQTGDIRAYVGSADYWDKTIAGQVDMVASERQPGSALKPFLVFEALKNNTTAATVIADLPVRFDSENRDGEASGYYPKNFTSRYYGPVTVRDALGSSLNIPMVEMLKNIGLRDFFGTLRKFGMTFPENPEYYGEGVILGGAATTLHDVARGYASLALYGQSVETRDVLKITREDGTVIFSASEPVHEPLYPDEIQKTKQASAILADILSDNKARALSFGEANLLDTKKNLAVKSGTTKDFRDNLAFGYSPNFVVGVWVGNADNSPMEAVSGVTGSVPILHDILLTQYSGRDPVEWPDPGNIVTREVCLPSGLLMTPECVRHRVEKFIAGTEPVASDTWWKKVNGKIELILPSEYADWAKRSRLAVESGEAAILSPQSGDKYVLDSRLAPELQSILFTASEPGHDWVLNGKSLKSRDGTYLWKPSPGEYELSLDGIKTAVTFSVR